MKVALCCKNYHIHHNNTQHTTGTMIKELYDQTQNVNTDTCGIPIQIVQQICAKVDHTAVTSSIAISNKPCPVIQRE